MPTRSEHELELARVLVVDDDLASRLTLQTLLKATGYSVDSAASASEAFAKLDEGEYELVLTELDMESPEAGLQVVAHARMMAYKPATAVVRSYHEDTGVDQPMLIEPEDVPELLDKVAGLIGDRASRRLERELKASLTN